MDLFGVLCFFGFLLFVVTLVGHGTWLLVAAIWRELTRGSTPPVNSPTHFRPLPRRLDTGEWRTGTACKVCDDPEGVLDGQCRVCGAFEGLPPNLAARIDNVATRRELQRLLNVGAITATQHAELITALGEQEAFDIKYAPPAPTSAVDVSLSKFLRHAAPTSPVPYAPQPPQPKPSPTPKPKQKADDPLSWPITLATLGSESTKRSATVTGAPAEQSGEIGDNVIIAETVSPVRTDLPPPRSPTIDAPPRQTARQSFADMLHAFMEQKNIRWGEILSGMLIIGSAIGLVVSLRATLKEAIPYFPALMFLLITAAIHGAGIYSLRRWNLKTTSRGVLLIATLLVPLNFLAAILLSGTGDEQRAASDPVFLTAVVIGIVAFSAMNFFASRALFYGGWWRPMVAVVVPSAWLIALNRLVPATPSPMECAASLAVPIGAFLFSTIGGARAVRRRPRFSVRAAAQWLLELALAAFALGVPIGLFLSKTNSIADSLSQFSPTLSVIAAAIIVVGLVLQNRSNTRALATYRTTGTAIVIGGAGLLCLAIVFAWPDPNLLIAVGAVNALILFSMAIVTATPLLHLAGTCCAALAVCVTVHKLGGAFIDHEQRAAARLIELAQLTRTAWILTALGAVIGGAGVIARRWLRAIEVEVDHTLDAPNDSCRTQPTLLDLLASDHAAALFASAAGLAALSLAIGLPAGFFRHETSDALLSTPLFFLYAVGILAGAWIAPRVVGKSLPGFDNVTFAGSLLLLVGLMHALGFNSVVQTWFTAIDVLRERPYLSALIAHAALMAICVLANRAPRDSFSWISFIEPAALCAQATSLLAVPGIVWVRNEMFAPHAGLMTIVASVWLAVAWRMRSALLFSIFQGLATGALAIGVAAFCQRREWWTGDLFDPRFLQMQVCVLAVWCTAWSLLRKWLGDRSACSEFVQSPWIPVDRWILGRLIFALLLLAAAGCWPGVAIEMGFSTAGSLPKRVVEWGEHSFGGRSWMALVLLAVGLAVSQWERLSRLTLTGFTVLGLVIPLLIAGRFQEQHAVASALRWLFAFYSVVLCIPAVWFGGPRRTESPSWFDGDGKRLRPADILRGFSWGGGLPTVALTTLTFAQVSGGVKLGGPDVSSVFHAMGNTASFATPLALIVAVLVAFAVRESHSPFMTAAGALFQYVVTLGCLLQVLGAGLPIQADTIIRTLQWNVVGLGLFHWLWRGLRKWIEPDAASRIAANNQVGDTFDFTSSFDSHLAVFSTALGFLGVLVAASIFVQPQSMGTVEQQLGHWWNYVALGLGAAALVWQARRIVSYLLVSVTTCCCLLATFVAASARLEFATEPLVGLHWLAAGWCVVAALLVTLATVSRWRRGSRQTAGWLFAEETEMLASSLATVVGLGVLIGVIRGLIGTNPPQTWWAGQVLALAILAFVSGVVRRQQGFAYTNVTLKLFAVAIHFELLWLGTWFASDNFLDILLGTSLLAALVWLSLEIVFQQRGEPGLAIAEPLPAVHRVIALLGSVACLLMSGLMFLGSLARGSAFSIWQWHESSVVVLLVLLIGLIWDKRSAWAMPLLYVWNFSLALVVCSRLVLTDEERFVALIVWAATIVAASGYLWRSGISIAAIGNRLGIPDPVKGLKRTARWLPPINTLISCGVTGFSLLIVLFASRRELRMAGGFAPALLALGTASMAQKERRSWMQRLTFVFLTVAGILLSWADIAPTHDGTIWLQREIRMLIALVVAAFVFGGVMGRRIAATSDWRGVAKLAGLVAAGCACATLIGVLVTEGALFIPGQGVPIDDGQIAAVAVVLVFLVVAFLMFAVAPGRDPLSLSEDERQYYVYTAQVIAALLFAHLYLARPGWFDGALRPWWPFIVMAIAFGGVGVGELFQRMGWRVLAEPLQRTGAFLPLLPALGMWVMGSDSDYSAVLFTVGLLYAMLSIARRSWISGVISAVAGNGAFWAFLSGHTDFSIWTRPQLWLIPPAISALLAGQLNRRRLSEPQLTSLRYACMLVIYLSSTSEMFLVGIGESLWPPMILCALAIAGVLVGIALRIRAFLFMGTGFVLLSMISMVWHATKRIGATWPWWAFGFLAGLGLLVLFGMFEKKRTEVKRWIEQLRSWEQ